MRVMAEFGVSDKQSKNSSVVGLGVKVEKNSLEAFPSSKAMMMMMVHDHNHHRPLSSSCDGDGPTNCVSVTSNNNNHINHVLSGGSAPASAVRNLQPFDIPNSNSAVTTTHPAFIAPEVGMAASLGFPFTYAQWKELERQAMIYKYMVASVPVPPDLLIPTSLQAASRSSLEGGLNLRLSSSGTDPEPGRCRRTDGKKWRCSRDVAPNHKYCERHMHRGRPRSRKHVEVVHANTNDNENLEIKKARYDDNHPFSVSSAATAAAAAAAFSNPTTGRDGSSSQLHVSNITQPYRESSSFSLDKFGFRAASFEPVASVTSIKEPRGLDWMLKGHPISMAASNPEWQPLMANKVVLNTQNSCNNNKNAYISTPNHEEPLHPNSYGIFNPLVTMEPPQSEKPRSFIDAWSNAETMDNNANTSNNKSYASSNGNLSLSSLALSMAGGSVDEDNGTIQMGLGIMEPEENTGAGNKTHLTNWLSPAPWVASSSTTPGGPLAEVLRPSMVAATANEDGSNPSSPLVTNAESGSPLAMRISSPSGVLQKTLASLSDSSSNSSPTIVSSRANSETPMIWFSSARPN